MVTIWLGTFDPVPDRVLWRAGRGATPVGEREQVHDPAVRIPEPPDAVDADAARREGCRSITGRTRAVRAVRPSDGPSRSTTAPCRDALQLSPQRLCVLVPAAPRRIGVGSAFVWHH